MTVLQERYREVSDRIGKLVLQAGREPHSVSLIAVSKTFPSDGIREVYAAGQRDFGENYIQEWYGKTEELADLTDIVWHVIGDVQSNKTKFVAERAHWVHLVCRLLLEKKKAQASRGRVCAWYWCRRRESNPRPSRYECAALPTELHRRFSL